MGTYQCQICEDEFEHPYEKKTCSDICANASRSATVEQQWEEQGEEMTEAVSEAMNTEEVREHMRRTQLGDQNSMAGRSGADNPAYKPYVPRSMHEYGYMVWRPNPDQDVKVHRLLAVAEYGLDAIEDKHVHHVDGTPWLNIGRNLEPLTNSEHQRRHAEGDLRDPFV